MMKWILGLLGVVILYVAVSIASLEQSYHSSSYTLANPEGVSYACEVVEAKSASALKHSAPLVVLVSRTGGTGKQYPLRWENKGGRCFVDGKAIDATGKSPVLFYKDEGQLKSISP